MLASRVGVPFWKRLTIHKLDCIRFVIFWVCSTPNVGGQNAVGFLRDLSPNSLCPLFSANRTRRLVALRPCFDGCLNPSLCNRQPEPENRTVSELAVHACFPVMIQNDVLDNRQSQASASSLARPCL